MGKHTAIIGAGAWGTAFAIHLSNLGHKVFVWCRSNNKQDILQKTRTHPDLPDIKINDNVEFSCDPQKVITNAKEIICMIPSSKFELFFDIIEPYIDNEQIIMWGCKGWVKDKKHIYFHEYARARLGQNIKLASLSGPTFALELAQNKPTAIVIGSDNKSYIEETINRFHGNNLRCYGSNDMASIQFCGVYKNIIAVAAGISDGLELGANARAALLTRGIFEMQKSAKALGLSTTPILGMTGMGDVFLSATSDLSRNRRLGLYIGKGHKLEEIKMMPGMATLESINNLEFTYKLATSNNIELPIANTVLSIIKEKCEAKEAIEKILARQPKFEFY